MANKLKNAARIVDSVQTVFGKQEGANLVRQMAEGRNLSTAGLRRKAAHLKAAGKTADAKVYSTAANLRTAGNVVKGTALAGAGAGGMALVNARSNPTRNKAARIANDVQ